MKKLFIILLCVFVFCFYSEVVQAYDCKYNFSIKKGSSKNENKKESYTAGLSIDPTNNTIKRSEKWWSFNKAYNSVLFDKALESNFKTENLIKKLDNKCPSSVYVCKGFQIVAGGTVDVYAYLINMNLIDKIEYGTKYYQIDNYSFAVASKEHCVEGVIAEDESDREAYTVEFECENYDKYYKTMKNSYCDINSTECKVTDIQKYKSAKDILTEYCKNKIEYGSVGESCVSDCLGLKKAIADLEGTNYEAPCGFSERLISFIANILKWVKYILPVIVMVLGILDFIKALSSEKDDEMKKAQGRFMKRLISAALVFLIPLIIEFVLDKMGFDYNECGLF